MDNHLIIAGVLLDENTTWSLDDVCQQYHIPEALLLDLLEHGLLQFTPPKVTSIQFDEAMLRRIQAAHRLQQDLGINSPGVVLALELRDELMQLREELRILQHHLND